MGIIGSTIKPFKATAFKAGENFFDVTDEDRQGASGRCSSSIRRTSPSSARPSSKTSASSYNQLQKIGVEVYAVSTDTHFSHKAWHDTSEKIGKLTYAFLGDQNHVLAEQFRRAA